MCTVPICNTSRILKNVGENIILYNENYVYRGTKHVITIIIIIIVIIVMGRKLSRKLKSVENRRFSLYLTILLM